MKGLSRKIAFAGAFLILICNSAVHAFAAGALGKVPPAVFNISHRGASGYAPEHTLASYDMGQRMQGDFIEIDLQMTKDGELVALHDESLDRTTNGKGLVKELNVADLKKLDAGSWFNEAYPERAKLEYMGLQVPTLPEILERFGTDAKFFIETKSPEDYPGMEEKLIETLYEYNLIGDQLPFDKIMIQSFSVESLKKIHEMDDSIPLIQLLSYYSPAVITDLEIDKIKEYASGVGMHFTSISPGYVKKVKDSGLLVIPYTVNEKEDMIMLLDWGVSGMFTNYPDRLADVIKLRTGKGSINTETAGS
ncbi:glycerophosphodiester phosphodiesterase [Mesobacillus subterraneus]|uniref:Glycerophosphodiester phosphodiesterase n=1 Tax=Mesobacillus subterraneus TaxID=285983 RepID=A0A427TK67_9BACI|nr:glycerophosphodiester phosphodiesterase [Mesobacillus subterraneus]RSD24414.1 glycerophosphodiester phosphodiesterase [Mesobacillus subterraneus]